MRSYYEPESVEFWLNALVEQQYGDGYPSFVGMPYQRGMGIGSFFRGLFRAVAPIVRSVGKTAGREALRAGAGILTDTLQGRDIKDSLNEHGRKAIGNTLKETGDIIQRRPQVGRGLGTRKGLKRTAHRKRRTNLKRIRGDIYDGHSSP